MPFCPKCGEEVIEIMDFCPRCGFSLKDTQYENIGDRVEAEVKRAKEGWKEERWRMGGERWQRYGEPRFSFLGSLIGGLILICLGLAFYFQIVEGLGLRFFLSSFIVIVGIIVIALGMYMFSVFTKK
jgi:hypothetical protein